MTYKFTKSPLNTSKNIIRPEGRVSDLFLCHKSDVNYARQEEFYKKCTTMDWRD